MSETRKIAAILVADVVGYSRLAGADEDRTLSRLRGLRSDVIDPAIAAHRGRIVKRTGDGSLIKFRSVVDAAAVVARAREDSERLARDRRDRRPHPTRARSDARGREQTTAPILSHAANPANCVFNLAAPAPRLTPSSASRARREHRHPKASKSGRALFPRPVREHNRSKAAVTDWVLTLTVVAWAAIAWRLEQRSMRHVVHDCRPEAIPYGYGFIPPQRKLTARLSSPSSTSRCPA